MHQPSPIEIQDIVDMDADTTFRQPHAPLVDSAQQSVETFLEAFLDRANAELAYLHARIELFLASDT